MVRVNELRIGNLLNNGSLIVKVSALFISHFRCETLEGISMDTSAQLNYTGIPLTEEVLKACGFNKGYEWLELAIGNETYFCSDSGESVWLEKIIGKEGYSVGLGGATSLHQLQNLYYSLTGQELKVNL